MKVLTTHHHDCQQCGTPTECFGELAENYDGSPEVICLDFHLPHGELNHRFVCESCATDDGEPADDDDAWSGGFAENH